MTFHHALEIGTGLGAAGLVTVAQLDASEGSLLQGFLKLGAAGVLGLICYFLIRENRKQIADMQAEHGKIVARMCEAQEATAQAHAATIGNVEAAHRDSGQRYESAVQELFRVQRETTATLSASITDATKPVSEMIAACSAEIALRREAHRRGDAG